MEHDQNGERRPTREECIREAGAWLARVLEELDAKSPRQAAEDAHREGGPSVDELERLIRLERGLPPVDEAEPAPVRPRRPRKPQPAVQRSAPPAPRRDPLAAVAGMSKAEKRELAAALAAELEA